MQRQHLARLHAPLVGDDGCIDSRVLGGGQRAAVLQTPRCSNDQVAGGSANRPCVMHADACFGTHQVDLVGVHPAQPCDVDRIRRRRVLRLAGLRHRGLFGLRDVVHPGDHVEPLRPQARIDL